MNALSPMVCFVGAVKGEGGYAAGLFSGNTSYWAHNYGRIHITVNTLSA